MPNEQLKKEMVERGKGKIAKLIGSNNGIFVKAKDSIL